MGENRDKGKSKPPLVGREEERKALLSSLESALKGQGRTFILKGPTGIGKTRLLEWLEAESARRGFKVIRGGSTPEGEDPLSLWELRMKGEVPKESQGREEAPQSNLSRYRLVMIEEDRPDRFWQMSREEPVSRELLVVSRETGDHLRGSFPHLNRKGISALTLSRLDGEGHVKPTDIDGLGSHISRFLEEHRSGVVFFSGIEYLVNQNNYLTTLRFVEFLREAADTSSGTVVLSMNPGVFEPRELALLRAEADACIGHRGTTTDGGTVSRSSSEPRLLSILERLEMLSRETPLLLTMENFQRSDSSFRKVFELASRLAGSLRILLVATWRSDDIRMAEGLLSRQAYLEKTLETDGLLKVLNLESLGGGDISQLLENVPHQKSGTGETIVPAILRSTHGNPLAVLKWTEGRSMALLDNEVPSQGREVPRRTGEGRENEGEPGAQSPVFKALSRIADRLPQATRTVLDWASILGDTFDPNILALVTHQDHGSVETLLSEVAEKEGVVERRSDGQGRWNFVPHLMAEVLTTSLEAADMQARANVLAEVLSRVHPEKPFQVARLFHMAGDSKEEMHWAKRAIDKALEERTPESALTTFKWVWEQTMNSGQSPEAAANEAIRITSRFLEWGEFLEAKQLLEMVVGKLEETQSRWRIEAQLVEVLVSVDRAEAMKLVRALESEFRTSQHAPSDEVRVAIAMAGIRVSIFDGRYRDSVQLSRQLARFLEERTEGPRMQGHLASTLYWLSWALLQLNDIEGGWEQFRKGFGLAMSKGDAKLKAHYLNLEGEVFSIQGDLAQSIEAYEEAVILGRRLGHLQDLAIDLANLAGVQLRAGDVSGATANLSEALALSGRFHLVRPGALARIGLARVALARHKLEEAFTHAQMALGSAETLGIPWLTAACKILISEIDWEKGDIPSAMGELTGLKEPLDSVKGEDQLRFSMLRGRIRSKAGEREGAFADFQNALRLAALFRNPDLQALVSREIGLLDLIPGG